MLHVENSNELEIRGHKEKMMLNKSSGNNLDDDSQNDGSKPKLKHINHFGAGTKLSGPTKEDRMNLIRRLIRFFVQDCKVPVDVKAPCLLDEGDQEEEDEQQNNANENGG